MTKTEREKVMRSLDLGDGWMTWEPWVKRVVPRWEQYVLPLFDRHMAALEIGAHQGRSATWMSLALPPGSCITCVDPWRMDAGGKGRDQFDANTSKAMAAGGCRVIGVQGTGAEHFLSGSCPMYDLIFIDGDHHGDVVMLESVLAWHFLNPRGVIVWDDVNRDKQPDGSPVEQPPIRSAVGMFIELHGDKLDVLWQGYQVGVRKAQNRDFAPP